MQVFKLKELEHDGLYFALDMIINERIYLSTRDKMNDIDEGSFETEKKTEFADNNDLFIKVRELIDHQRFTCFIKNADNPLMWAHYSKGFSGIAFEYNLDTEKYDLREISYKGKPTVTLAELEDLAKGKIKPQDINILKSKVGCWKYEDEWRLYGDSEYIYEKPVAIILGANKSKLCRVHSMHIYKDQRNIRPVGKVTIAFCVD